ncbi:phospholipid phosphatase-related protein type 5-like isoform X2 [Apostichopus japonicus]|uniref:phospholipid phosphatase-related protein type 5-like isoform X2 n=1 Tax=Stichopus japonicus TaxID=307972 RepID=UPI003AB34E83
MLRKRREQFKNNNFLIPCVLTLDFLLLAGLALLWYFMTFWDKTDVFRTSQIYIPCQDQVYYSYPKDPDDGLLPDTIVYVLGFALPTIVILFGEAILAIYLLQGGRHDDIHEKEIRVCRLRFHPLLRRSVRYIGLFSLGAFILLILVRFGQLVLGRPKPHYFDTCDGPVTCTDPHSLVQLTCEEDGIRESLPSTNAALSMYSSLYVGLYLTTMLQPLKTVRLVHPLFCLVVFSIPYMVGLERVVYHEAHWIDVIAGWVLGALAALYMVYFIVNLFKGADAVSVSRSLSRLPSFSNDTIITNPHREKTLEMRGLRGDETEQTFKEQFRAVQLRY